MNLKVIGNLFQEVAIGLFTVKIPPAPPFRKGGTLWRLLKPPPLLKGEEEG